AVHHLPHDHRPLATAGLALRDQRFDQSPFLVGQIARISQLAAVVTGAVLARPQQWPLLESGHYSSITGDSYDSSTLRTDTKSELRSSRPREERAREKWRAAFDFKFLLRIRGIQCRNFLREL